MLIRAHQRRPPPRWPPPAGTAPAANRTDRTAVATACPFGTFGTGALYLDKLRLDGRGVVFFPSFTPNLSNMLGNHDVFINPMNHINSNSKEIREIPTNVLSKLVEKLSLRKSIYFSTQMFNHYTKKVDEFLPTK